MTNTLVATLTLFTSISAFADRKWNEANDPRNFETDYKYNFNVLPNAANLDDSYKNWSDSYWPIVRGSIADRWQVPALAYKQKDYRLLSVYEILNAEPQDLDTLSPIEKFEIIRGRYDFPMAKSLKEETHSKGEWWRGICNGWTQAAMHFDEPRPIVYKSPITGVTVPLGSADIKALLGYYYANFDRTDYTKEQREANKNIGYIGKSCRASKKLFFDLGGSCSSNDVNAAAFHIVLTNEIGLRHRAFAVDRDPTTQVWNHPYVGYEMKVLNVNTSDISKKATKGTVKEVTVSTTVKMVNELYNTDDHNLENDKNVAPQYQALGKGKQRYLTLTYEYLLELDAYDQIIGGEWTGDEAHPDLLWRQLFNPEGLANDTKKKPGYIYKDAWEDWSILADIVKLATEYAKEAVDVIPGSQN